jgi:hypothetical protein
LLWVTKKEPPEFFPTFIQELHLLLLASQVIRHKSFLFKSSYVTNPLGGTRYATTGVTSSTHAKHESDEQLLGQSSFKRYVHIQILLPSLFTRSFPQLEEA